jgi:hypothetical protein
MQRGKEEGEGEREESDGFLVFVVEEGEEEELKAFVVWRESFLVDRKINFLDFP